MNDIENDLSKHYSPSAIADIMQKNHYPDIPLEDIMNVRTRGVGMRTTAARRHIWYVARKRSAARGKTFSLTSIANAWNTDHATVLLGIVLYAMDNNLDTLGLSCKRALDWRGKRRH